MTRLPRDISSKQLIQSLKVLGYSPVRQTGSHIRLTTSENGQHHITIPNHDFLRVGTLNAIVSEIATHFKCSKNEIISKLF